MTWIVQNIIMALTLLSFATAHDLNYSGINTVTDNSRFTYLHPEVNLTTLDKTRYCGGLSLFSLGKRISGDRLLLNFHDSIEHTKVGDLESLLSYPSQRKNLNIITRVDIYAAVSSEQTNAYLVDGGIRKSYCHMLFTFNKSKYAEFEIFIYGY